MEKWENPFTDKLVGLPKGQEHLEQAWHDHLIENVTEIGGRHIEDFEIPKTPRDIEIISFAETSVDSLLKQYGRTKQVTVPLDNIHILKENGTAEYTEGRFEHGAHSTELRSIIADRAASDVAFCLTLFHELLHLKSYTAMQVMPGNDEQDAHVIPYRTGISVVSRDGKTIHLQSLEEGIIGYLTAQFYESALKGSALFKNETPDNTEDAVDTGRVPEVEKLNDLIEELFQKNTGMFSSKEDVLKLFINAQVNGDLLPVGRLIENTFGPGALKRLDVAVKA